MIDTTVRCPPYLFPGVVRIFTGTRSNLLKKREEMKKIAALTLSLFLSYGMALADTPKDADAQPAKPAAPAKPKAAKKAEKSDSALAAEIEELRQAVQAQQEQLQLLKEELAKRDRQVAHQLAAGEAADLRDLEVERLHRALVVAPKQRLDAVDALVEDHRQGRARSHDQALLERPAGLLDEDPLELADGARQRPVELIERRHLIPP